MTKQNMRYEWEDAADMCADRIGDVYMEPTAVEAAIHFNERMLPPLGSVARADVLKDILGDVEAAYVEALEAMAREYDKAQAKRTKH